MQPPNVLVNLFSIFPQRSIVDNSDAQLLDPAKENTLLIQNQNIMYLKKVFWDLWLMTSGFAVSDYGLLWTHHLIIS